MFTLLLPADEVLERLDAVLPVVVELPPLAPIVVMLPSAFFCTVTSQVWPALSVPFL
jgi:hypothetical protein